MNHVSSYAALADANVKGTLEILRLAVAGAAKAVHFVSSVDVVAADPGREAPIVAEPPPDAEGYTASKWVGDQLVARAGARGVPVCLFRTGYVGPHATTGDANGSGWFELYLRAALALGSVPDDVPALGLTPVDRVVDAIVALSGQRASRGRAWHLVHRERPVGAETVVAAARDLGRTIERVSGAEWRERLARHCAAHPDDCAVILGPYLDAVRGEGPRAPSVASDWTALALAEDADFIPVAVVRAFLGGAS